MFIVLSFITFLAILVSIIYLKFNRVIKLASKFSGPPALPIFGNGLDFIGREASEYSDILRNYMENYEVNNCVRVWIGPELNILMSGLKDIEIIFGKSVHIEKAHEYSLLRPWLREGLLISNGRKWFQRRKILTPAFHFKVLEQFIEIFDRQGNILIKQLKKLNCNDIIDFHSYISSATLDVICEDIETIFGKSIHLDKSDEYGFLQSWLREGLLISRGRKWFQRRKILTPAFHFKALEEFVQVFNRQGKILVAQLKKNIDKNIDLNKFVTLASLDIICESAMGVSVYAQTTVDSQYVNAVKTISTVLHKRMFDIVYRFDFIFKFTKLAQEQKRALEILHSFTENVIISRREELIKSKEFEKSDSHKNSKINDDIYHQNDLGSKRKMAFLDILLQSEIDGQPLSNLDIREEVDTFMFEGHDTTSSAILFFFYNIATNPETQKKCFDEVLSVLGNDNSKSITLEDLNCLNYIDLCIKETLRLFPSVPLLGRRINEECEINGKIIPAGTNIGVSPLILGRNETIFPNANAFIPERFDIIKSTDKMNPYAYIPFSAGPRNCIGQKFAMLEIKSIVANILRNFEITYCNDVEPVLIGELILKTKDPLMFKIKERPY